jgi:cytochrome c553
VRKYAPVVDNVERREYPSRNRFGRKRCPQMGIVMLVKFIRHFALAVAGALVFAAAVAAQTPAHENNANSLGPRAAPAQGEICVVCNHPVGPDDDVYIVNGQRMPVHRGTCLAELESHLEKYKARMRPAGNFLGVEPDASTALTTRWLALGLYVLLGLVFAALSVNRAINSGQRPVPWFFAGFFLNVFAWAVLVARHRRIRSLAPKGLAKVPQTATPLACPGCGRLNHPAASTCLDCGRKLEPAAVSEAARAGLGSRS